MSIDLDKCERLFDEKHLAYRAERIPCTVRNTYFNPNKTKDDGILMRKELILLDDTKKVICGIEYDDKGKPSEIFTIDDNGNRIKLVAEETQKTNTIPDLISERLNQARNLASTTKEVFAPSTDSKTIQTPKRTIKKTLPQKPLSQERDI